MAKSIKYKNPDTYHDAGNVYDNTQGKTQEAINAALNVTDEVSITEQGYTVSYCKSGNVATVIAYRNDSTTSPFDSTLTHRLPFRPWLNTSVVVVSFNSNKSFLQVFENGGVRIVHNNDNSWYRCVATFIAKDL